MEQQYLGISRPLSGIRLKLYEYHMPGIIFWSLEKVILSHFC